MDWGYSSVSSVCHKSLRNWVQIPGTPTKASCGSTVCNPNIVKQKWVAHWSSVVAHSSKINGLYIQWEILPQKKKNKGRTGYQPLVSTLSASIPSCISTCIPTCIYNVHRHAYTHSTGRERWQDSIACPCNLVLARTCLWESSWIDIGSPSLCWYCLQFSSFTMGQISYEFSKNHMLNFESGSF